LVSSFALPERVISCLKRVLATGEVSFIGGKTNLGEKELFKGMVLVWLFALRK